MSNAISRRLGRRFTAMGAGAALVATGLSLGAMAPAFAAESVVTGALSNAQGNPVYGYVEGYRQNTDGTFNAFPTEYLNVDNGLISSPVEDGVYKFLFQGSSDYTEAYLNKADLATADPVTVGGGATALAAWTIDQPVIAGTVVDPSGRPVEGVQVRAFDAADESVSVASNYTDEKGAFYLPVGSAPVKVFVNSFDSRLSDEWYNDKSSFATADAVTGTAAGTSLAIALAPAGAITGQVTSDAGAPLEYVEVFAGGSFDVTDKSGVYVLENVRVGSHKLEFHDPIREYDGEYYNNVQTSAEATAISVAPGQVVSGINANLTPLPAVSPAPSVELSGVIKDDAGTPLVGVPVYAYDTPNAPAKEQVVESTRSNRAGVYSFTRLESSVENQYKIQANTASYEPGDDNAFAVFGSWFGGRTSYDRAPAITVPAAGADISLTRAGGIAGAITGVAGLPLEGFVSVTDADGSQYGVAGTKVDNTFLSRELYPGTYKVSFSDFSSNHAGEWWKDASFEDATTITVRSGQVVTGLSAVLAGTLSAKERPEVDGYPWVGKPVTVDSGTWNIMGGTRFTYEWLSGSTVVGTGATFTPSASLIGDRLSVRVTAENGRLAGTTSTASTAKVGYKPKIKLRVKGAEASLKIKAPPVKAKKVKGKVVVKEIVKVKADGTIKYKKIAKARIKKGKGTVSLGKLKKGKHKLVFFFTGKGKVGSNEEKKKVKVKR